MVIVVAHRELMSDFVDQISNETRMKTPAYASVLKLNVMRSISGDHFWAIESLPETGRVKT